MEHEYTPDQIRLIWARDPSTWSPDEKQAVAVAVERGFTAIGQAMQLLVDSIRPAIEKVARIAEDISDSSQTDMLD